MTWHIINMIVLLKFETNLYVYVHCNSSQQ